MQDFASSSTDDRLLRLLGALDLGPALAAPCIPPADERFPAHLPVLAWLARVQRPETCADLDADPERFAPASVDLLRLEAPSAEQFAAWRPRLSARALVVCHDIGTEADGHSAFWQTSTREFPFFAFAGFGVLGVGLDQPTPLEKLFDLNARPDEAALLRALFARLGEAARAPALRASLAQTEARLREREATMQMQALANRQRLDQRDAVIRQLIEDVRLFRESTSWRLTAPLRVAIATMRGLRRPPPAPPPLAEDDAKLALRADLAARLREFLSGGSRLCLPHSDHPEVSILLVLHNQAELTFGCLASLADEKLPVETIILDNASSDATEELLRHLDGATVIRSEDNLHFLRGVNRAAREARGRALLLLNNDAQLRPGTLTAALATLDSAPDIGAAGGRIVLPDGTLQEAGCIVWRDGTCSGYARGEPPEAAEAMFRRDVDFCSGVFLLTPRALFEELGGLDEAYAPYYYEEADYCVRLQQRGLRVVYEPDAPVLHHEFGSAVSTADALARQQRNRAVFQARHAAWLVGRLPPSPDSHLTARSARRDAKRVLVIEDRVPHPHLGAGYPRTNDFLHALAARAAVTLLPLTQPPESWAEMRASLPAEVEILAGHGLLDTLRRRRGFYDAVVVSRPHNLKAFAAAGGFEAADTRVIYDAEAIAATREAMRHAIEGMPLLPSKAARLLADEMTLARRAGLILCVSVEEQRVFAEHGITNTILLSHALRPTPTDTAFENRTKILFVGALHEAWTPNADGLRWFAEEILPPLRRALRTPIRLAVVGENRVQALAEFAGLAFDFVGAVKDLRPHYAAARLVVAPTRFAAGLPHKVMQAAAHGVPVVATTLLARQLGWAPGQDLLAADDAQDFAAACARLWQDRALWQKLRDAALDRVRAECDPQRFQDTVARLITP